jgi:uncharacterized hydrophobic protein (TIGR00271 family)
MLKLTAYCPADKAQAVIAFLREEPRVRNVTHMQGVEVSSGGDVVMAFLPNDIADGLLDRLRTLRHWAPGELSFMKVDLFVRSPAGGVGAAEGDEEADTISREMIMARARDEARLTRQYLVLMAMAGVIAVMGLVHSLPILIVGAMSLSPDLAPANAISVALVMGAIRGMVRSLRTLALGLGLALGVAFVVTLVLQALGVVDSGVGAVDETMTTFVTVVSPTTAVVALAAGVAAMLSFVTDQGQAGVGVAISVTTIPAAAYIGVALADAQFALALDALVVLATNVFFLVLAQSVTLLFIETWRRWRQAAT